MEALKVGEKYPGNYRREGVFFEYNDGFHLYIFLPNITPMEAQGFKKGKYKFALTEREGVLYFLSEFKGATNISDSPFHFGLYNDDRFSNFPKGVEDGYGFLLSITVVDNISGIVKALRSIGLSTELSNKLIEFCVKQNNEQVSRDEVLARINRTQANYSSKDLYKYAIVEQKG